MFPSFFSKEEKIKNVLNKTIREYKKTVYKSLTTTIEESMQDCYQRKIEDRDIYNLVV